MRGWIRSDESPLLSRAAFAGGWESQERSAETDQAMESGRCFVRETCQVWEKTGEKVRLTRSQTANMGRAGGQVTMPTSWVQDPHQAPCMAMMGLWLANSDSGI